MSSTRSALFSRMERSYAGALLELAQKVSVVDALVVEVVELDAFVRETPDVTKLLSARNLGMHDRLAAAEKLFKGRLSDLLYRFVLVLVRRDRFDELHGIAQAFVLLVEEEHGEVEVEATAAAALDQPTLDRISARLGEVLKRKILLSQKVDEAQIGGLKVRIADEVYDGSLVTQLRLIKEQLTESGRERARREAASL